MRRTVPEDGGCAFPVPMISEGEGFYEVRSGGMSVRDYFAAKAMAACISADTSSQNHSTAPVKVAAWAYEFADAMLVEREKPVAALGVER